MNENHGGPANLFNSAVVSAAIAAAFELNLLDKLADLNVLSEEEFCRSNRFDRGAVRAIVSVLEAGQIVRCAPGITITRGEHFDDVHANQAFFHWLFAGYGELLKVAGRIATRDVRPRQSADAFRSAASVARAAADYGARFVDPYVSRILETLSYQHVADLGCGSARRLIDLLRHREDLSAVGVDRDREVVAAARQSAKVAGLSHRLKILNADVSRLSPRAQFTRVDLLMCFFMGHDLWPRWRCVIALRKLRRLFPAARALLLCDTFRWNRNVTLPPIFSLGFEFVHELLDEYVPTEEEWYGVFAESDWTCGETVQLGIPNSAIFVLRPGH